MSDSLENEMDALLSLHQYERKAKKLFDLVVKERASLLKKNWEADKKIINTKLQYCRHWRSDALEELSQKRARDNLIGLTTRYFDDLSTVSGWDIQEGQSNYPGTDQLCSDLGCWQKDIPLLTDLKTSMKQLEENLSLVNTELVSCKCKTSLTDSAKQNTEMNNRFVDSILSILQLSQDVADKNNPGELGKRPSGMKLTDLCDLSLQHSWMVLLFWWL